MQDIAVRNRSSQLPTGNYSVESCGAGRPRTAQLFCPCAVLGVDCTLSRHLQPTARAHPTLSITQLVALTEADYRDKLRRSLSPCVHACSILRSDWRYRAWRLSLLMLLAGHGTADGGRGRNVWRRIKIALIPRIRANHWAERGERLQSRASSPTCSHLQGRLAPPCHAAVSKACDMHLGSLA